MVLSSLISSLTYFSIFLGGQAQDNTNNNPQLDFAKKSPLLDNLHSEIPQQSKPYLFLKITHIQYPLIVLTFTIQTVVEESNSKTKKNQSL